MTVVFVYTKVVVFVMRDSVSELEYIVLRPRVATAVEHGTYVVIVVMIVVVTVFVKVEVAVALGLVIVSTSEGDADGPLPFIEFGCEAPEDEGLPGKLPDGRPLPEGKIPLEGYPGETVPLAVVGYKPPGDEGLPDGLPDKYPLLDGNLTLDERNPDEPELLRELGCKPPEKEGLPDGCPVPDGRSPLDDGRRGVPVPGYCTVELVLEREVLRDGKPELEGRNEETVGRDMVLFEDGLMLPEEALDLELEAVAVADGMLEPLEQLPSTVVVVASSADSVTVAVEVIVVS